LPAISAPVSHVAIDHEVAAVVDQLAVNTEGATQRSFDVGYWSLPSARAGAAIKLSIAGTSASVAAGPQLGSDWRFSSPAF